MPLFFFNGIQSSKIYIKKVESEFGKRLLTENTNFIFRVF